MTTTRSSVVSPASATLFAVSLAAAVMLTGWESARGETRAGGSIAFLREGRIWTIRSDGSAERRLPPKRVTFGDLRWSPNGRRIAFVATRRGLGKGRSSQHDELFVMNADGSGAKRLTWTRAANTRVFHDNPSWSPDGRRIVFDRNDDGPEGIYVINANGRGKRSLIKAHRAGWLHPRNAALSPDGRKIALTDGDRVFVMKAGGGARPRPVARVPGGNEVADLTWSPDGRRIAALPFNSDLIVMRRDGNGLLNVTRKASEWKLSGHAWSPDGRTIAVAIQEQFRAPYQIWLVNPDGTGKRKLTTASRDNCCPVWSPDGKKIAFGSDSEIYVMNADGSDQRRLTNNAGYPVWSPK